MRHADGQQLGTALESQRRSDRSSSRASGERGSDKDNDEPGVGKKKHNKTKGNKSGMKGRE